MANIFNLGWIPLIQQELRRYFASTAQGALADSSLQPSSIGVSVQPYDVDLVGLAALSTNGTIERTSSGTFGTFTTTAFAKTILDDADAATARTTLGLAINTNVQAYSAELAAVAALTGTGLIRRTGAATWAAVDPWLDNSICQGRLTLSSGVAVPTSNVTAATIVYFTPFNGNLIALYTGTEWVLRSFLERSLSLSGLAANTNYDVFALDSGGTVVLEALAWANATTRNTALVLQDGVWVRSGLPTRRYLGTVRTTGTVGQSEDSESRRYVWNLTNQQPRILRRWETANWTYNSTTWRALNNSTANRVEWVSGLNVPICFNYHIHMSRNGGIAVAIDSTTTPDTNSVVIDGHNSEGPGDAGTYSAVLVTSQIGYHFAQMIEAWQGVTAESYFYGGTANGKFTGIQSVIMA